MVKKHHIFRSDEKERYKYYVERNRQAWSQAMDCHLVLGLVNDYFHIIVYFVLAINGTQNTQIPSVNYSLPGMKFYKLCVLDVDLQGNPSSPGNINNHKKHCKPKDLTICLNGQ